MYLVWAWTLDVIGVFLVILRFPFSQPHISLTRQAIKLFRLEDLAILNIFKRASTRSKYTERCADGNSTIN